MSKLILIRHGQSLWNLENKFAGWKDIDLSDNGIKEAINAGKLINKKRLELVPHATLSIEAKNRQ